MLHCSPLIPGRNIEFSINPHSICVSSTEFPATQQQPTIGQPLGQLNPTPTPASHTLFGKNVPLYFLHKSNVELTHFPFMQQAPSGKHVPALILS